MPWPPSRPVSVPIRTFGRSRIKVAIITGEHTFDVTGFHDLLNSIPDVDFYAQHLDNYVADLGQVKGAYDTVVFYNYHQTLAKNGKGSQIRNALEELVHSDRGIVLWHHGVVAFSRWQLWAELSGIEDRTFAAHKGQTVQIDVVDARHPITRGLSGWAIVDETYSMSSAPRDSNVLLTTDHPLSMKAIAWTRQFGRARVFCYQSGHDREAYTNPNFRTVLARGIRWAAGDLEG
jgi:type 1 glutamine amidotransferase